MTSRLGLRHVVVALAMVATLGLAGLLAPTPAHAATISVGDAVAENSGDATVRGYVVGQPTGPSTVVDTDFPTDYALALADSPEETSTDEMLFVQVGSAYRAEWGLASNPSLLGEQVDVTGSLEAYFSHPGLKSPTGFALADGGEPTPEPTPDPGDYYAPAAGKTGDELRAALNEIIDDHTTLSYSEVWDALKETDEDPDNPSNVIELYTRRSISKDANGGDLGDWNREHTWAKSHGDFGTAEGPGTDLHHLRPSDVQVNSIRGNKDFDEGGSAVSGCAGCLTDGDSFEPTDEVKGDVARMMFYMAIRYEGDDQYVDLELNESTSNQSQPFLGKLSVLKAWHEADPVSASETRRNDIIYTDYQHNRNPFIDHPEWVEAIW